MTKQHFDKQEQIQKGQMEKYEKDMQTFKLETFLASRITESLKPLTEEISKLTRRSKQN